MATFEEDSVEEHDDDSCNEITSVLERRTLREFEQQKQLISGNRYFGRQSVIFLGTMILTERCGGSTRAYRLKRLFRQRREQELRLYPTETEASEEHSE